MTSDLARPVVLVGLMGSGKSTVGRRLANRLGRRFVDLDEVVEATAGRSIPTLFEEEGESAFRAREESALADVLAWGDVVVATGGGVVVRPANRARLAKAAVVVWLRARPDTLLARVGDGGGRPLLAGDPEAALRRLAAERADAYAEVADVVVDVDGRSVDAVVETTEAALAGLGGGPAGDRPAE